MKPSSLLSRTFLLLILASAPLAAADQTPGAPDGPLGARARGRQALTYDGMIDSLRELEAALPEVELSFYGTSGAGRALPLLVVNRDRQFTAKRLRRTGRPLILVLAATHGDESAGTLAVEELARGFESGDSPLLARANLLLVPALDVDGLPAALDRPARHATPAGLDLDRDWLKLQARETRSLMSVVAGWSPDLVLDLHTDCLAGGPMAADEVAVHQADTLPAPLDRWLGDLDLSSATVARLAAPAGSALGYFALRPRPALRVASGGDVAALHQALVEILQVATAEPDALKRVVAEAEKAPATFEDRGAGYLVEPGWPTIEEALRAHGIGGHRVQESTKAMAAELRLRSPTFARRPEEGLFRVAVEVQAVEAIRALPAGSLWIPADQPAFRVVRELLEPRADESLLAWGLLSSLFESGPESVAPVSRLATPPPGRALKPWG